MENDKILAAFDVLMTALVDTKAHMAEKLKEATMEGRFADAQQILQKTRRLQQLSDQVNELRDRYLHMDQELACNFSDIQSATSASTRLDESSPELAVVEGIFGARQKPRKTSPVVQKLGENTLRIAILEALQQLKGRAYRNEVVYLVRRMLEHRLSEEDVAKPGGIGTSRLDSWISNERQKMIREGLLNPNAPYGIWEITEAGRAYLESFRSADDQHTQPNRKGSVT